MHKLFKLIILLLAVFTLNNAYTQCNAEAGIPIAPITNYNSSVNNPSDALITNFIEIPTGTANFGLLITNNLGINNAPIVGFTEDGSWDFNNAVDGDSYCFYSIAYNQAELDFITNNPAMQALFPIGCLNGGETMEEFVDCLISFLSINTINFAIDSVLSGIVPLIVPEFIAPNQPPCYDIATDSETYCITYNGTTTGCFADAGIVQAPNINTYVEGQNTPNDILVSNFYVPPFGTTNNGFVITEGSGTNNTIVGFTDDGTWDFNNAIPGQSYCFTSFAYNQSELDLLTNNADIQTFFAGCLTGGDALEVIFDCITQTFPQSATIDEVSNTLTTTLPLIVPEFQPPNNPPCFNFASVATQYCITYDNAATPCFADAGFVQPPNITNYVVGQNTPNDLLVNNFYFSPFGTTNSGFVITEGSGSNTTIVGFTDDGTWDFNNAIPGQNYCFTSFAYNQSELDLLTNNSDIQYLFAGCLTGGDALEVIFDCITQTFPQSATIDEVSNTLSNTFPLIVPEFQTPNAPPCFNFASVFTQYCITYVDADDDNDGILSAMEDIDGNGILTDDDTDYDGIPNYLDNDDDNDGILTINEDVNNDGDATNDDTDNNGTPNYLDNDDDGDNVITILEDANGSGNVLDDDSDNDGTPNYLDNDDDGDGILTADEDFNGDGLPWNDDADSDGIVDYLDTDVVGINEYYVNVNILPNPNNGNFKIAINENNFELNILNSLGETIYSHKNKTEINLKDAASGIYFIKITTLQNKVYLNNFVIE